MFFLNNTPPPPPPDLTYYFRSPWSGMWALVGPGLHLPMCVGGWGWGSPALGQDLWAHRPTMTWIACLESCFFVLPELKSPPHASSPTSVLLNLLPQCFLLPLSHGHSWKPTEEHGFLPRKMLRYTKFSHTISSLFMLLKICLCPQGWWGKTLWIWLQSMAVTQVTWESLFCPEIGLAWSVRTTRVLPAPYAFATDVL